jgi:cation diffusion facilitator family transporter
MKDHDHKRLCVHPNDFHSGSQGSSRKVSLVFWLTVVTMIAEILGGWRFESMALLADGWHMGSHVLALGLALFAYWASRRFASDRRFAFGTWKIEVLAGFSSALMLLAIAMLMIVESFERFFVTRDIAYPEAMGVAVLGLVVNVVSAFLLSDGHTHAHAHAHAHHHDDNHDHDHGHDHGHQDLNLKSAYVHVVTDAATSVFALVALACGWLWGWGWMDPLMGLLGAIIIILWSKGLLKETTRALIDREMDHPVVTKLWAKLEAMLKNKEGGELRVLDFHVWRVGRRSFAAAVTVEVGLEAIGPDEIRSIWGDIPELIHATVEIQRSSKARERLASLPGG